MIGTKSNATYIRKNRFGYTLQRYRHLCQFETERNLELYGDDYLGKNWRSARKYGMQIDHKYSVYYGWRNCIPYSVIADITNLRLIKRKDNKLKGYASSVGNKNYLKIIIEGTIYDKCI